MKPLYDISFVITVTFSVKFLSHSLLLILHLKVFSMLIIVNRFNQKASAQK